MAVLSDITTGTISVANGSATVTGVGTAWQIEGFREGDFFIAIGAQLVAVILSVNSNTSITLTKPWEGATLSGAPYRLRYQADGERVTAKAQQLIESLTDGFLSDLVDLVPVPNTVVGIDGSSNTVLIPITELIEGIQVDAKVANLAGRAAYDAQPTGFSVLVADVGDGRSAIYFKQSNTPGDWSPAAYLTGPSGTVVQTGPYNPATAYVTGNLVLQNGSTWVARVNTTGNAPPTLPTLSNTWWYLVAAAGNGFVFRGTYSGATAYLKDDVVFNQNSSWIALIPTTGNAPPTLPTTSNTQWAAIAVRGAGDVSGPGSSIAGRPAVFADATGKVLAMGGTALDQNLIVNSCFQVSQLNGNASGNTSNYFPADMWNQGWAAAPLVMSAQRIQSPTYLNNSFNKLRFIVTTADTSIVAGDYAGIFQTIEGLRVYNLGWGSAGAIPLVARFTWQGPAGTYAFSLRNTGANNRTFIKLFTITAPQANTPQIITFSIPAETTGTWATGNVGSFGICITLAAGSTYTGGTDGGWSSTNSLAAIGITNNIGTVGNTFELSDVGIYPDPNSTGAAPPWKAPLYPDTLAEVKRYYNVFFNLVLETSSLSQSVTFPDMRTSPTVTNTSGNAGFIASQVQTNSGQFYASVRAYGSFTLDARI